MSDKFQVLPENVCTGNCTGFEKSVNELLGFESCICGLGVTRVQRVVSVTWNFKRRACVSVQGLRGVSVSVQGLRGVSVTLTWGSSFLFAGFLGLEWSCVGCD